ncbi:MAG TPA: hypothetical protein V6C95_24165 [Coleofasciculaceae cyanobacterium]
MIAPSKCDVSHVVKGIGTTIFQERWFGQTRKPHNKAVHWMPPAAITFTH